MDPHENVAAPWYRTAFTELYLELYAHRSDAQAAAEILSLCRLIGLEPGKRVLDVCCGAGRHLAALRAAGLKVAGVDLSAELLARARGRGDPALRLVRGDMRRLPFGAAFDGVVNLFTSFGYFSTDRENEAALREMARVLEPGGRFVIDHMNKPWVLRTLVPRSEERRARGILVQERSIAGDRVLKRTTWIDAGEVTREIAESVRLYEPDELAGLLAACGLRVHDRWGSLGGDRYAEDSPRLVLAAHRTEGPACDSP